MKFANFSSPAPREREAMGNGLSLRQRLLLFFAAIAVGGVVSVVGGLWLGFQHSGLPETQSAFVTAGAVASFGIIGIAAWVWLLFDENVGRALDRLAAGMRAQAHADGAGTFDAAPGRYLGDLGPAATALTDALAETRDALAEAVERETTRLKEEKARLEALLSDVPAGVLLCSGAHQLVFYNGPATDILGAGAAPGLDRKVFDALREAPLMHAYERLVAAGDAEAVSDLLVATRDGARVLSGRMRLLEGGSAPGYVLTLRDVTGDLAAHAGRDRLLEEIFDRIRRPAANLQTVIGVLAEDAGSEALNAALLQEVGTLAASVKELADRYDAARGSWAALPSTRSADLVDGFRARAEAAGVAVKAEADDLILRCDGFETVALLAGFARRLKAAGIAGAVTLRLVEDGAGAMIELGWTGPALTVGMLEDWLAGPLDPAAGEATGRAVLTSHATECWPEAEDGRAAILLPIREARRAGARVAAIARQVVYDFDLLLKPPAAELAATPLGDLIYVVFDTETTGLLPEAGDEIVQIAGLRLVNGRRIQGEVLDMLVDPGRPIPPGATAVHGISDRMVAGAPGIAEALTRFHRFAEGAVLIAHNAPFDMTFLKRREAEIGQAFDHPILDTVLLSAVVYGQTESHSLDALAARLGITIPEEARHTAIGDTIATAEAFLKLLPMLKGKGIVTFGDVLTEVRKHGRLLRDLNA
ncbi:3'-5' exonuclease [Defluviimonas salinarum]|uniref:DNA-directed DNA polymerase n=1 Tax=Defluviimonas salinarum TaxID=2992147 RepID=A0ABT3JA11_9RHOB|nr:exonuclease domain-containing protein [Defluviimonas salinarum]MCW3784239.1 exonuclease domain-containing protein [Defluviimonas salinarum]